MNNEEHLLKEYEMLRKEIGDPDKFCVKPNKALPISQDLK